MNPSKKTIVDADVFSMSGPLAAQASSATTGPLAARASFATTGPLAAPEPARGLLENAKALVGRVTIAAKASAWASIGSRALLFVLGLAVLAWIGHNATAATPSASAPEPDAGSPSVAPTAAPAPASIVAQVALPATPTPDSMIAAQMVSPSVTPSPPGGSPSSHARATAEDPVYVNVASSEELRRLPGVGAKRADAIVALRARLGRFQRLEELLRVKGVGRSTLRKWRPLIRLDMPDARAP